MAKVFVVDASAVLKLALDEPASGSMRAWFGRELSSGARMTAPDLLPYEVCHGLARVAPPEIRRMMKEVLGRLVDEIRLESAASLAVPHVDSLSAYDASYVGLALATASTLVTYDGKMAQVAREAGVKVVAPDRASSS